MASDSPLPLYFTDFSTISKSIVSNTWFVVAGKSPYLENLGWTVHMFLFFGPLKCTHPMAMLGASSFIFPRPLF
jgi:hypothetical protein